MNRRKKIIILLAAICAMCAVTAGFLPVFRDVFAFEPAKVAALPAETIYYAPLEPEETTEAVTEPLTEPTEIVETVPQTVPEETERTHYDTVPNYYETDYPDIRFGTGSFANYGSGVTSVAMVATYLTGYEYRPDELAAWLASYTGNQIQTLEHISDTLQLPWEPAENFHIAL